MKDNARGGYTTTAIIRFLVRGKIGKVQVVIANKQKGVRVSVITFVTHFKLRKKAKGVEMQLLNSVVWPVMQNEWRRCLSRHCSAEGRLLIEHCFTMLLSS